MCTILLIVYNDTKQKKLIYNILFYDQIIEGSNRKLNVYIHTHKYTLNWYIKIYNTGNTNWSHIRVELRYLS